MSDQPAVNEEWATAGDESPTQVIFDTPGDVFTAVYQGEKTIEFEDKEGSQSFIQYLFRDKNGELFGINESYKIKAGMDNVPEGALTRITYMKDVETGKPQPMKDFKVEYRMP